ncbi:MAG: oligoribonuclease [gamma proteobacterium symbiont of Bathyaustriella thionipta]|nr:oligoribonuclease [gamma proteobacterium symbiont of Bathyaustriella thionipta]
MKDNTNLIWIDLEMTGLEPQSDVIIEIATVMTDAQLKPLAEGPVIAIHQSDDILNGMDEWNQSHHGSSGLIERVRNSQLDTAQAEQQTLDFLSEWIDAGQSPMCGNSICQDRRFMARLMPKLEAFFHYRNLDVSSVKELARRWAPKMAEAYVKEPKHLALDDVYDSIDELNYYREHFLRSGLT